MRRDRGENATLRCLLFLSRSKDPHNNAHSLLTCKRITHTSKLLFDRVVKSAHERGGGDLGHSVYDENRHAHRSLRYERKISLGIILSNESWENERRKKLLLSSPRLRPLEAEEDQEKETRNTYTHKMRDLQQQMMRASTSFAEGTFTTTKTLS